MNLRPRSGAVINNCQSPRCTTRGTGTPLFDVPSLTDQDSRVWVQTYCATHAYRHPSTGKQFRIVALEAS